MINYILVSILSAISLTLSICKIKEKCIKDMVIKEYVKYYENESHGKHIETY